MEDSLSQTTVLILDICFTLKPKYRVGQKETPVPPALSPSPPQWFSWGSIAMQYLYYPGQPGICLGGVKVTAIFSQYSLGQFMG